PGGESTTVHLEYSLNGTNWTPAPDHTGITGTGEQTVGDDLAGLRPAGHYSVRAVAANVFFSTTSSLATFTTDAAAPLVETGPVSDRTGVGATLTGRLTPRGVQCTYYFEYGETTGYGRRVPANVGGVAGNGYTARAVTQAITGLTPGAVYHYRLVGTNAAGTTYGDDKTFAADASSVAKRAYEMVSPVDKHGAGVDNRFTGTYAREDGNGVMYAMGKSVLPDAASAPFIPRVLGTRSAQAWGSQTLDVPTAARRALEDVFYSTVAVSKDLSRALVVSPRKLTPDAVEGTWNLYLREPAASPLSAERLTLVASDDHLVHVSGSNGSFLQAGTSDDARTLIYTDNIAHIMYEASLGKGQRLASLLPDGTAVASEVSGSLHDPHQVSADGSRIYFVDSTLSSGGPLYLRENGTTTVPISVSHRPGDPATPVSARFIAASPDGRYVMFSSNAALTADAPSGSSNSSNGYRYDLVTDSLTYVATDVETVMGAVAETGDLYYRSGTNLFHGHGGTSALVAALGHSTGVNGDFISRDVPYYLVSPNGRYFAFATTAPLGGYDNDGGAACHALRVLSAGEGPNSTSNFCQELYLYDSRDGALTCPSCRLDGGKLTGDVTMGQFSGGLSSLNRQVARSVLDDGTVFFDTPDPLVTADHNGVRDVYASRNGRATLISRGSQGTPATFLEATPDGSDVFFATADRLVGQDRDNTVDLYDARVGGGIAEQSPAPGRAPCSGDQCREPAAGPTTSEPPESQTRSAIKPNPKASPKVKISVLRSSFSAKTLTITLRTSTPGRIRVSGSMIAPTTRTAATAGTYTLKVPLSRKARAARRGGRRVKFAVKVSLIPPFAAPTTTKLSRTLGK
ncbi:MAG: hypothetical protein QOH30_2562, partial [Baekduia sp.]|nr:hypothetical protein [Baekduia sp.]